VATDRTDVLQGTLDLLILKTLALGPLHGLGISRRIGQVTQGAFRVMPGSLFPALHRLEDGGWVAGEWGESENKRAARYYRLTRQGRRQLETEKENWARVALAISRVLEA
jgi:PadR family transcriptional regulator